MKGKPSGPFRCTLDGCTSVLQREVDLVRHQRYAEVHATHAYRCPRPKCGRQFTRPDAFARHFNDKTVSGNNLECRKPLLKEAKKDVWDKDIPNQLRDKYKVPYKPKAGSSKQG